MLHLMEYITNILQSIEAKSRLVGGFNPFEKY